MAYEVRAFDFVKRSFLPDEDVEYFKTLEDATERAIERADAWLVDGELEVVATDPGNWEVQTDCDFGTVIIQQGHFIADYRRVMQREVDELQA